MTNFQELRASDAAPSPDAPFTASRLGRLMNFKLLAVIAAAATLAACGSTPQPAPPPIQPEPEPPVVEPEPEPEPIPEPEEDIDFGLTPPHMEGRDVARVALLLPFSAENSAVRAESLRLLRAAELALFERAGGNLLLMPRDTSGTSEGARRAARGAITDGADIIIGPLFAAAVDGAAGPARRAGVPVIAFSTDAQVAGDGVYLLSFPPEIEVERIVDFAAMQGVTRFAYLGPSTRYGEAVAGALRRQAEFNLGEVTDEAFYSGEVEGMASAARRLTRERFTELTFEEAQERATQEWIPDEEAPFQAVILPEGGVRLRTLAPLLIGQQVDPLVVRFMGTGLWHDPELLREPALHGGWFAGPDLDVRGRFERAYESAFGDEPSRIASLAYDAAALAAHLDGGELGYSREAIENSEGFYGADGLFRFGMDGLIERGLAVYQIHPRGFREIDPAPESFEPDVF